MTLRLEQQQQGAASWSWACGSQSQRRACAPAAKVDEKHAAFFEDEDEHSDDSEDDDEAAEDRAYQRLDDELTGADVRRERDRSAVEHAVDESLEALKKKRSERLNRGDQDGQPSAGNG